MGLTAQSTGRRARAPDSVPLREPGTRLLALAGNPNVGKSTLFNALTNLHQHTGNWPGKTVACAQGEFGRKGTRWRVVDLPGTYSLLAHSAEEEVARDVLCFGGADAVVVVCDGTCLAHSLTLALQVAELCPRTVLCVNLLDEAAKKGIRLDLPALEDFLGIPVVGTSARSGRGLEPLLEAVDRVCADEEAHPLVLPYPEEVERGVARILPALEGYLPPSLPPRWAALRLLEGDRALCRGISQAAGREWTLAPALVRAVEAARKELGPLPAHRLRDRIAASVLSYGEEACRRAVLSPGSHRRDRFWDRILTSRATGIPMMLLLLGVVLWLTIAGANGLSQLLAQGLGWIQSLLSFLLTWLNAPGWLHGALVEGVVQVVFWVVAVMLPPMAIFFPLFTLLEDLGYLPRVAFNLDHCFQRARTCGKQALTMAMGFGCNAAGVVGCRIIDSPRERLIAILTNSFVPCNGRFPTLIALLALLTAGNACSSLWGAVLLTGLLLLGILLTFLASRLLSSTLLRGMPSSFALELPPYRRPQVGQVLVRSLLDRTVFVLGRAAAVAAPAGLLLWLLANLQLGGDSLLACGVRLLDPVGRLLGMDGAILLAFVLAFPANELFLPVLMMIYLSAGSLAPVGDLSQLQPLLAAHGWTGVTVCSTLLFCLVHWPCSTTCLTIARETGSKRWTLLGILLPAGTGMFLCFLFAGAARLLGAA